MIRPSRSSFRLHTFQLPATLRHAELANFRLRRQEQYPDLVVLKCQSCDFVFKQPDETFRLPSLVVFKATGLRAGPLNFLRQDLPNRQRLLATPGCEANSSQPQSRCEVGTRSSVANSNVVHVPAERLPPTAPGYHPARRPAQPGPPQDPGLC